MGFISKKLAERKAAQELARKRAEYQAELLSEVHRKQMEATKQRLSAEALENREYIRAHQPRNQ